MKKIINAILALTLTTLLSGCGVKFGIENRRNERTTGSGEKVNISESINEISTLDVSISVSNVNINYYDGSDIEVSGELSKYSKGIKTEKKSDKLIIIEESEGIRNIGKDSTSNLSINIPKNFNGDFEFHFGVGEAVINDLVLNNIKIENGVGELILNEISFSRLDLESGVGETTLQTSKKTGEITIDGGVGDTNISLEDINGDFKFEGGMGSATIKVPVDAPININTKAGLGEARVNAKTASNAKYNFDINVGIGEVKVTN